MQRQRASRQTELFHFKPHTVCCAGPRSSGADSEPLRRFVTRTSSFNKEGFEAILKSPGAGVAVRDHLMHVSVHATVGQQTAAGSAVWSAVGEKGGSCAKVCEWGKEPPPRTGEASATLPVASRAVRFGTLARQQPWPVNTCTPPALLPARPHRRALRGWCGRSWWAGPLGRARPACWGPCPPSAGHGGTASERSTIAGCSIVFASWGDKGVGVYGLGRPNWEAGGQRCAYVLHWQRHRCRRGQLPRCSPLHLRPLLCMLPPLLDSS